MKIVWFVVLVLGLTTSGNAVEIDPCAEDGDLMECLKAKVYAAVRGFTEQDNLQVSESLSIVRNSQQPAATAAAARGLDGVLDSLARYVRSHDLVMHQFGSTLTMSARSVDQGRVDVSLRADEEDDDEARSTIKHGIKHKIKKIKKSKLRRLIVPVVIVLLLKAITLIPLLIGVLGVKTWNALQLGFGSFIVSFALAVFQLCTKLTDVFPKPPPVHPWQARGLNGEGEGAQLAYRAHVQ